MYKLGRLFVDQKFHFLKSHISTSLQDGRNIGNDAFHLDQEFPMLIFHFTIWPSRYLRPVQWLLGGSLKLKINNMIPNLEFL